ncbi:hypothetical protein A0H81_01353 [Grifola frondosa]|uniref:Uncharacterized protein n=1 Tax=Grifola frondosa TaxID=5627 RepID=A0A1C7MPW3_GRIFR|nr:hypothetical protein A0H81_01353 [Grifola frondosa]
MSEYECHVAGRAWSCALNGEVEDGRLLMSHRFLARSTVVTYGEEAGELDVDTPSRLPTRRIDWRSRGPVARAGEARAGGASRQPWYRRTSGKPYQSREMGRGERGRSEAGHLCAARKLATERRLAGNAGALDQIDGKAKGDEFEVQRFARDGGNDGGWISRIASRLGGRMWHASGDGARYALLRPPLFPIPTSLCPLTTLYYSLSTTPTSPFAIPRSVTLIVPTSAHPLPVTMHAPSSAIAPSSSPATAPCHQPCGAPAPAASPEARDSPQCCHCGWRGAHAPTCPFK